MKQEIEYECKNLVSEEDFIKLMRKFSITQDNFVTQQNYYFDTEQYDIKNLGAALRIRKKQDTYTLTLKQPLKEGILETHQNLTLDQAHAMLTKQEMVNGDIATILKDLGVSIESIKLFGDLTTSRAEIEYRGGILTFDHSSYLDTEDYELEYEVQDLQEGEEIFSSLLDELNIPRTKTENKIKRMYIRKLFLK
ncbi:CYTH domain-containing protein [Bacillus sp. HMF5848]|uniref:CYTH domain-containing protein n=1 Tax=Bacillus sp. HMF5848 TaxID=2495421 RepID=UPI000F7B16A3|nr:CYTH domain-containing protein [Bacillus sp. HMF5848]RSK26497.1 CYTH domain-containing protein [Bacillus sp. HMF5848]